MPNIKDMADVCELAHELTVKECQEKNINVDCLGIMDCTDGSQDHDDPDCVHYGFEAQQIFNKYYDELCNKYNI